MARTNVRLGIVGAVCSIALTLCSISLLHLKAEDGSEPTLGVTDGLYDPGIPSDAQLADRFGATSMFYVEPGTVGVAPELGPPPAGSFVPTRQYMVAHWRLEALYQHLGDRILIARIESGKARLESLRRVLMERRSAREPKAGDADYDTYQSLCRMNLDAFKKRSEQQHNANDLLGRNGLGPLYTSAVSERRADAQAEWRQALSNLPELAEALQSVQDETDRIVALDQQMTALLAGRGAEPLVSPEESTERERLIAEIREAKSQRELIQQLPNVTAARHLLWGICHEEYARQQEEYQSYLNQLRAQGNNLDERFVRLQYEEQVWRSERPHLSGQ